MNLTPKIALALCTLFTTFLAAQTATFPANGAPNPNHNYYAFTNCTLHVDAATTLNGATLLIRDGLVVEAGEKVSVPAAAVSVDLKGRHIYPSFIELYSDYGLPEQKPQPRIFGGPQMESNIKGAFGWNQAIRAEVEAHKLFSNNEQKADELRKLGFGTVLTSVKDGIVRGSGALVLLSTHKKENENVLKDRAAAFYSFNKGSSAQDYPSSLMGSIALLRQTYLDGQWYATVKNKTEYNISLESFNALQALPSIIEANGKLNVLRADRLGDEFRVKYIIKGSGDEYQRIHDLELANVRLIVPLNFPDPFDVDDPYEAELISTAELKHWEMAPANAKFLQDNFIPFALTTADLKDKTKFLKNLRKAIAYGLSEKNALKTLTSIPAEMIGMGDKLGALKKGMIANFIITSKNIFEENAVIYENWVNGYPYRISDMSQPDIRGRYELAYNNQKYTVEIGGEPEKLSSSIMLRDTAKTPLSLVFKNNNAVFHFNRDSATLVQAQLNYNPAGSSFSGKVQSDNGAWYDATLTRVGEAAAKKGEEKKKEAPQFGELIYPFTSYGRPEAKENILQKFKNRLGAVLIKKATVWTNDTAGILKEHDVYVVDGKIVRIAPNIDAPKNAFAKVIDGRGMHLTAGIIDEHSHIAISEGVNEGTQASSAEVRIGDVVNSEDVNIYRQLSGGVTCAHLLHGSANPIGGQTQLIKLRWGLSPEELKYEKWDGFIKFALGENVKQSNWGDFNTVRFPQTRMGVEQVYYDYFTRAREYAAKWNAYTLSKEKNKIAPRRDIELDALVEILNKKRFITCHSYVKSEIDMLMHVGDSMGFRVNTFTHILEGYKVADKMKKHGVAASTFSDWWAYKMEVMDAIPYNAALMTKMGIVTSVNSDDAEMGRRLNQEAAKAVKYGGLSEEAAWKLCTLNPAKMLHIDDKVGSVTVGKVADLVLWTDNPLSINAKVSKTIIDGIIYFDADEDAKLRGEIRKERARIIQKMLKEKQSGAATQKPAPRRPRLYHCDTMENTDFELRMQN
jgi:imidazolonepropionase-like amidohydrolase